MDQERLPLSHPPHSVETEPSSSPILKDDREIYKLNVKVKDETIFISTSTGVEKLSLEEWLDPDKVRALAKKMNVEYSQLFIAISNALDKREENRGDNVAIAVKKNQELATREIEKDMVEEERHKPRVVRKVSGNIGERGCFEAIRDEGRDCFLVYDGNSFETKDEIVLNGEVIKPLPPERYPYELYGFERDENPSLEDLVNQLRQVFMKYVDTESKNIDIFVSCVLLSYQQHKVQTVPYLFLYGDTESGKSTVLSLFNMLCYRPLYGVTLPPADIYGYLEDEDEPGCILEDEAQGLEKDEDKAKIYKVGYKKGAKVPRTIIPEHGRRRIEYYRPFCFKAVASEKMFDNKGLNERFIFIQMSQGTPSKDLVDMASQDQAEIRKLRNHLLKWRMLTKHADLPELDVPASGRMKELWKPLLQVTLGTSLHDRLLNHLEEEVRERMLRKQETLEGKLVKAVLELVGAGKKPVGDPYVLEFSTVWDHLCVKLDATVDDRNTNRMSTPEYGDITKQYIGRRIRELFGVSSTLTRVEGRVSKAYRFDPEKLNRLAKAYGYVTDVTDVTDFRKVGEGVSLEKSPGKGVLEGCPSRLEASPTSPESVTSVTSVTSQDSTAVKQRMGISDSITSPTTHTTLTTLTEGSVSLGKGSDDACDGCDASGHSSPSSEDSVPGKLGVGNSLRDQGIPRMEPVGPLLRDQGFPRVEGVKEPVGSSTSVKDQASTLGGEGLMNQASKLEKEEDAFPREAPVYRLDADVECASSSSSADDEAKVSISGTISPEAILRIRALSDCEPVNSLFMYSSCYACGIEKKGIWKQLARGYSIFQLCEDCYGEWSKHFLNGGSPGKK